MGKYICSGCGKAMSKILSITGIYQCSNKACASLWCNSCVTLTIKCPRCGHQTKNIW